MTSEASERIPKQKTKYWSKMALGIKKAFRMHRLSDQISRDPITKERPWGNITEHCLVEAARAEVLGRWIGLPEDVILDMKTGVALHDFSKRQEITATREANKTGNSPLAAVKAEQKKSELLLQNAGFSDRVRRLAGSAGGYAPQLIDAQNILDKPNISDEDWAYLIVHYVDDCSAGAEWVEPSRVNPDGTRANIIDYRVIGNKAIADYNRISQEIGAELEGHPLLGGMNNHDSMSIVSHGIEQRLAQRIAERTGESIDPLLIPELVDQKIRQAIESRSELGELHKIGIEALTNAKRRHDELGDRGLQTVQKNQFGETALLGDIECERAIFEVLRRYKLPIRIISEEHGVTDITENPVLLGIVDGIDGTVNYKNSRGRGRYGTILGIFSNLNPTYGDYNFSGIMEHSTGFLYYALPNHGSYRRNIDSGETQVLRTSGKTREQEIVLLYHSLGYDGVSRRYIDGIPNLFPSEEISSLAPTYIDLSSGKAEAIMDVTRKGNLEQMASFGLIREAGGVMITLDGQSVARQNYSVFGQQESIPLITASSMELALSLRNLVLTYYSPK